MTPDPPPTQTPPPAPPKDPAMVAYEGGPLGAGIDWSDPNSKLAPFYLSAGGMAAFLVGGLVFLYLSVNPLLHTDFWAHLKYGEWIVANRTLPQHEPLCAFTDNQAPMFDAMWLTQVGYHALFRLGGAIAGGDALRQLEGAVELLRLVHLLAATATVAFLGLAYCRVSGSVYWAVLGMLLLIMPVLGLQLWVQRPQTFAMTCFAALLCGLSRPVITRRAMVWMPLVMVLWANLHGAFVVGFGLIGVFWLGRVIEVIRAGGWSAIRQDDAMRRLFIALLASFVAVALINPYGPKLFVNVLKFGGHANLKAVGEWQPLDFSQPTGGHVQYLLLLLLVVGTQLASPKAFTPTHLLLVLSLGVWPLFQQRAMWWWIPVVPWIMAPHWVAAAEKWGWNLSQSVPDFRKTVFTVLILLVMLLISPASNWLKARRPTPLPASVHPGTPYDLAFVLKGEKPLDSERFAALAKVVRDEYGGKFTGRLLPSEMLGEYLLWSLPPEAAVMMFNHSPTFSPEYWNEFLTVKTGGPGWWEILDRYRPEIVVFEADVHPQLCDGLRIHPGWRVVLDEAGKADRDPLSRLFIAVRKREPAAGGKS